MLRIAKEKEVQNLPSLDAVRYIEAFCTSADEKPTERIATDTKPTDRIATGSNIIEVDTGDVYFFDEVTSTWGAMLNLKA
mgnify:CR=1 FL=1